MHHQQQQFPTANTSSPLISFGKRKRTRVTTSSTMMVSFSAAAAAIVVMIATMSLLPPSAQAFSVVRTNSGSPQLTRSSMMELHARSATVDQETDILARRRRLQQRSSKTKSSTRRKTPVYRDDEDQEEDEDLWDNASVSTALNDIQTSTGSEVLPTSSTSDDDNVVDELFRDTTQLEKIAMSSITQQLPQRALQALESPQRKIKKQQQQQQQSTQQLLDMNFSNRRVSQEEEIELARLIQQGSALQTLRREEEAKLDNKKLTSKEWAQLAGLTTKELRRQVSQYRQAKHLLVTANMGLVHAVVRQQYSHMAATTGISREELVQEGSLGLLRAAELFDPSRGLRFSTYATVWIKGILSNSNLPELVKLPAREKTKWNKIQKAQRDLQQQAGASDNSANPSSSASLPQPSVEELASVTGLTVGEVLQTQRRMQQAKSVLSLDYERASTSRSGAVESNSGNNNLMNDRSMMDAEDERLSQATQLRADVIAAMAKNLDAREARLMRLRYGLNDKFGTTRSLAECADAMGLSQSRVQQLAKRCLKKLAEAQEAESLQEYLLTIA